MINKLPNINSEFTDIVFTDLSTNDKIEVDSLSINAYSKSNLVDILNNTPNAYSNNLINISDLLILNENVKRITKGQNQYKEYPDGSGVYYPVEHQAYPHYKIEMVTTTEINYKIYVVKVTLGNVQVEFNDLSSSTNENYTVFSNIDLKIMRGVNKFEIIEES